MAELDFDNVKNAPIDAVGTWRIMKLYNGLI